MSDAHMYKTAQETDRAADHHSRQIVSHMTEQTSDIT